MRQVKLQMQVTVDGFVAGPTGEQDWMVWQWDDVLKNYAADLVNSSDTFLLGRVTYEGMAAYWPTAAANPDIQPDDAAFANTMNNTPKIVFSRTLDRVGWSNTRLAAGTPDEEISRLKQQPGKDLLLYGGAHLASSFIRQGLIDEYHLFVNPVVLGSGMPIWKDRTDRLGLRLVNTIVSTTGIVVLHYQPERK